VIGRGDGCRKAPCRAGRGGLWPESRLEPAILLPACVGSRNE
jgi:hypothetical protein